MRWNSRRSRPLPRESLVATLPTGPTSVAAELVQDGAHPAFAQIDAFVETTLADRRCSAIARDVFGRWYPWVVLGGVLALAAATQIRSRLYPTEFHAMLPHDLDVFRLVLVVGRWRMPAALGRPWSVSRGWIDDVEGARRIRCTVIPRQPSAV